MDEEVLDNFSGAAAANTNSNNNNSSSSMKSMSSTPWEIIDNSTSSVFLSNTSSDIVSNVTKMATDTLSSTTFTMTTPVSSLDATATATTATATSTVSMTELTPDLGTQLLNTSWNSHNNNNTTTAAVSDIMNATWALTNWTVTSSDGNSTSWPERNASTEACRNDYCVSDEEYADMILDYIFPKPFEWVLIAAYMVTFIVGLGGNILVCFAVWRNQSMRTVTNYFIVNLAVADVMVILICLPPTVIGDITETWFLGSVMCKIVKYLQGVSVSVSVLTLSSISVERWYAICYPLLFRSTPHRAKIIILVIWGVSLLLILPEMIVVDVHLHNPEATILFTQCKPTWSNNRQSAYQLFLVVTVYCLPFMLMFVTYFQIAQCLWTTAIPTETSRDQLKPHDYPPCQETQLLARRKVAKMLIAVVVMFGICYLPVHLLNILRYAGVLKTLTSEAIYFALIAHWLCYFNSAINPVIYNFMSTKFRKEFANACACNCKKNQPLGYRGTAMYSYRYTNTFRTQNTQRTALSTVRHHEVRA